MTHASVPGFCLWKTDRQSADVGSLPGFLMDLPTLQNYLGEERRPLCIMDEGEGGGGERGGEGGPAFSCPTTKGRTDFQKRKEV